MNKTKNILLAGGLIFLSLMILLIIYIYVISQSIINLETEIILMVKPQTIGKVKYNEDLLLATQSLNPPGVYSTGMLVQISGTGGDGLRIRAYAGLNEPPMFLGLEGENFKIVEGPEIINNSIWWKIQSFENESKVGWAVQNYLSKP